MTNRGVAGGDARIQELERAARDAPPGSPERQRWDQADTEVEKIRREAGIGNLRPNEAEVKPAERSLAVFVGRGRKASAWAFSLEATLVLELAEARVAMRSVPQATLKVHATRSGRAEKADMQAAARARWRISKEQELGEDEADALCLLAWAVETVGVST